jgi:uncharacterized protein
MRKLLIAAVMLVAGDNAIADEQVPAPAPRSQLQTNPSNEPSQSQRPAPAQVQQPPRPPAPLRIEAPPPPPPPPANATPWPRLPVLMGDFEPLCQLMQRCPLQPKSTPDKHSPLSALQDAAEQGRLDALWKLGRMYADGDGVPRDDLRAFNYFSQIADSHPDEAPGTPQARFVANAFVALGRYYLTGIPSTKIAADRARARDMFGYAATYFGDADAQYELGQLYLTGTPSDPHQAARWLQLAAIKGHCRAGVTLGNLLFEGQVVPRQAARGLMWLMFGRDCAGADESWVTPVYDSAFKRASDEERALALVYLEDWLKGHRD